MKAKVTGAPKGRSGPKPRDSIAKIKKEATNTADNSWFLPYLDLGLLITINVLLHILKDTLQLPSKRDKSNFHPVTTYTSTIQAL